MEQSIRLGGVLFARQVKFDEPLAAKVVGSIFISVSSGICFALFTHRFMTTRNWKGPSYIKWLTLAIYGDASLYMIGSTIVQYSLDINSDPLVCQASMVTCLFFFFTCKKLLYLFLVDRAHIVRNTSVSRLRSKLYLFNSFGLITAYIALAIVLFIYGIHRIEEDVCVIGIETIPLWFSVFFDFLINIYLTSLFLIPILRSFSFRKRSLGLAPVLSSNLSSNPNSYSRPPIRRDLWSLARRTFIGSMIMLTSTLANLLSLLLIDGEAAWLCLLICKTDIVLNIIVLFWITSKDTWNPNRAVPPDGGRENDMPQTTSRRIELNRHVSGTSIDDISIIEQAIHAHSSRQPQTCTTDMTTASSPYIQDRKEFQIVGAPCGQNIGLEEKNLGL